MEVQYGMNQEQEQISLVSGNSNNNKKNTEDKKAVYPAKYTAKDSVFTDLFGNKKYLLQLYQALHPEDTETTEESIHSVTLKNILLDQSYNDLGFQVGSRLVVLVEAQASWTPNIIVRCLMYLAQTYQEYFESTGQNVYSRRKLDLPKPELYVIYTGSRKTRPDCLYLTDEFFDGNESAVEVKVKMIYDGREGDIIHQYVAFTRIYNEQVKLHGRTREAVMEIIRICKDEDVLREYLRSREKEVVDIMMMLFDDDYILRTYIESEKREAAEKAAKKAAKKAAEEATQKATQNADRKAAKNLFKLGIPVSDIAKALEVSVQQVEKWLGLTKAQRRKIASLNALAMSKQQSWK